MSRVPIALRPGVPLIVGSFGDPASLATIPLEHVREACDIVEIRLDLLPCESVGSTPAPWLRFEGMPLLFTARRASEGGACNLDGKARTRLLRSVLNVASLIDIEVASIPEMQPLLKELSEKAIPWIGSFHDFSATPSTSILSANLMAARNAGAAGFKAAFELGWDMDLIAPLALFLKQSPDFPVSLMGMGPLAPVSRVLFGQLGSVLNYGYLGDTPTAPGQWSARQLKQAIEAVEKA